MAHLTHEEIKGYGTGTMTAHALLGADRHLAECAACRYELRQTTAAPALPELVQEMGEPIHLSYEEMSDYVDAKIDVAERERMDVHASICRSCSRELKDLLAFDVRMAMELNAVSVPETQVEAEPNWLQRAQGAVTQFFATPARMRFAGAGVGLMVLGVFSLLQIRVGGDTMNVGSAAAAHVTMLSASTHPDIVYGGFLIAIAGLIALLYGLFKK